MRNSTEPFCGYRPIIRKQILGHHLFQSETLPYAEAIVPRLRADLAIWQHVAALAAQERARWRVTNDRA